MTLKVFRGDDKTWPLTFTDANGDPFDLTGYTIFFTVKEKKADVDADAVITKDITSHTDASGGISSLALTHDDTDIAVGYYIYDFQLVSGSGAVTTIEPDTFIVEQDITIRTS